jgi:hypothetical protein
MFRFIAVPCGCELAAEISPQMPYWLEIALFLLQVVHHLFGLRANDSK